MAEQADQADPKMKREQALPELSPADHMVYSRLADTMEAYHDHFRESWRTLYDAASTNRRPTNLSLPQFLKLGLDFCRHLTAHHQIEETRVFPVLARKMPAFRASENPALLAQHARIHAGLDGFQAYLEECRDGERELRLATELKGLMDVFGDVLWAHLDDEVRELGAENMRRFWEVEEMSRMPF
ncbi:MAG: hypothetical protein M1832_000539 [Thelocarpon impressellum]|nr:MAG: hypothetical protein M1832_000539 [Thelocarpon impressellum]